MKSRRFSLSIVFALSLFLVFIFVLSSLMKTSISALAQTDTSAPAPATNAPFKGKIVIVNFVQGSHQVNLAMEQVHVQKMGDHYFLVGKGVDAGGGPNWAKGHMTWVPVNSVTSLAEMDSVEELKGIVELMWAAYRGSQKGAPVAPSATKP